VIGYVKHGVGFITATETVQKEISSLTKEDELIFWGQTNDITFNNSTGGIKQTHNWLTENQHTNITFAEVSFKHY
jgi:hypothetical protein